MSASRTNCRRRPWSKSRRVPPQIVRDSAGSGAYFPGRGQGGRRRRPSPAGHQPRCRPAQTPPDRSPPRESTVPNQSSRCGTIPRGGAHAYGGTGRRPEVGTEQAVEANSATSKAVMPTTRTWEYNEFSSPLIGAECRRWDAPAVVLVSRSQQARIRRIRDLASPSPGAWPSASRCGRPQGLLAHRPQGVLVNRHVVYPSGVGPSVDAGPFATAARSGSRTAVRRQNCQTLKHHDGN